MKSVFTIIKKEFSRFFKDKRMLISVLLPGILIYVLYSVMGTVVENISSVDENYKPTAVVVNMPEDFAVLSSALAVSEETIDESSAMKKVEEGQLDLLVIFPENFSPNLESAPNVKIFYNSSEDNSSAGYSAISALLSGFQQTTFTINAYDGTKYDLATESDIVTGIFSMLIPMLMFSLLASACMMVAPESIAGEKERGTMATMLITPVKRWQLAVGKILSLACFAMLSGISSFIGVILSLPKLTGGVVNVDHVPYGAGDYFAIFALIISVVLLIVSIFSVLSAFAKSVKEAGALIGPFMIVIILFGMVSMFVPSTMVGLCAIPLLGSGLAMSAIMSLTASPLGIALSIISNIVLAAALVVLLAFMFNSERIMFKK